jgi:hypothetical protein
MYVVYMTEFRFVEGKVLDADGLEIFLDCRIVLEQRFRMENTISRLTSCLE